MAIHKNPKSKSPEAHTSKSKSPFGDHLGSGVRNKIGKVKDVTVGVIPATKKQMKTPPKKLA